MTVVSYGRKCIQCMNDGFCFQADMENTNNKAKKG